MTETDVIIQHNLYSAAYDAGWAGALSGVITKDHIAP